MANEAVVPVGEVRGTGIIRDKDGKVKGHFTFGAPATKEQFEKLKGLTQNGCDSNHQGA